MGLAPNEEDAAAFAILAPFAKADTTIPEGLKAELLGGLADQNAASELDRLSMQAVAWHGRTGSRGWLKVALWLSEQAWHSLPQDRSDSVAAAIQLHRGTNCLRYYQADHHQRQFLDAAVTQLTTLAEALPDDHAIKPMALTNLSSALQERYREQPGRWGDLDESVRTGNQAVALSAMTDRLYASRVNNHGSALRARYQRDARIIDLRTAAESQRSLLDAGLVPAEHRAMMMSNLAQALRELYEVTFDRALLREAARIHRAAVRLASQSSRPDQARILAAYGITMRLLYPTVRGARKAISLQQEALSLTDATDVARPSRTGSLAKSWQTLAGAEHGEAAHEAT